MSTELVVLRLRGRQAVAVSRGGETSAPTHGNAVRELDHLVRSCPEADVAWVDERVAPYLRPAAAWQERMQHRLEVLHVSCFQRCDRMVRSLGLVDFDSPFLLAGTTENRFPTWLVSPLAGIGSAAALRAVGIEVGLRSPALALFDFGYRALGAGVCCYSEPWLVARRWPEEVVREVSSPLPAAQVALLVRRHFGRRWIVFWLLGQLLFRRRLPLLAGLRGGLAPAAPGPRREAIAALHPPAPAPAAPAAVEAIIPTLGRPQHAVDLLADLSRQTLPPQRVVLVDQEPRDATLVDAVGRAWPFAVAHRIVPWVGACRARNLALGELRGDWVLVLDDDVRLGPTLVADLLAVARSYGVEAVNAAVHPQGQEPEDSAPWPIAWPGFSSGAALVSRRMAAAVGGFDEVLEGGFGEDYEYGVRLRLHGGHVLCARALRVAHLKAPAGGFRQPFPHPWAGDPVPPRPSPTVLCSRRKHLGPVQQRGYQLFYWRRRLAAVPVHRWPWELVKVARQWRSAVRWCDHLLRRVASASVLI